MIVTNSMQQGRQELVCTGLDNHIIKNGYNIRLMVHGYKNRCACLTTDLKNTLPALLLVLPFQCRGGPLPVWPMS